MRKYFVLQLKRLCRQVPALLIAAALLLTAAGICYRQLVKSRAQGSDFQKLRVGIVGIEDSNLLKSAVEAVKTMDSSSLAMDFSVLEEEQAKQALLRGELMAYMVIPEGFTDQALMGSIQPVRFVSPAGGEDILSLVRDEFTYVLAQLLLQSEQAAFALELVLEDYGYEGSVGDSMNELALVCAAGIIHRDDVYTVEELGVGQGLSFSQYLLSGFATLFTLLLPAAFATVWIRRELTLEQLLRSKGVSAVAQALLEFGAYCLVLGLLLLAPLLAVAGKAWWNLLPVILLGASLSYLIFGLAREPVSGVILHLIVALGLCYLCGCMYPTHYFPVSVQKIALWLPAAQARQCVASGAQGSFAGSSFWLLLAVDGGLLALAILSRVLRMGYRGEADR